MRAAALARAPALAALDLGSTRLKAAVLAGGRLHLVAALPSPRLLARDPRREMAPASFFSRVNHLLKALRAAVGPFSLGLCCQRSTFALRGTPEEPLSRLISWQDRRAQAWCQDHATLEGSLWQQTGLKLSPHYLGPKWATLAPTWPEHPPLGTLESLLIYNLSRGEEWRAEPSLAARTLLADGRSGQWQADLLAHFDARACQLAEIHANPQSLALAPDIRLEWVLADQAAGLLPLLAWDPQAVLINLGTGAFLLAGQRHFSPRPPWLCGLVQPGQFALEAPIPAVGDVYAPSLPHSPPTTFCLPDDAGWGCPYWQPRRRRRFSTAATPQDAALSAREGLLFRLFDLLSSGGLASRPIVLSGGGSADPLLTRGLATLLKREVLKLTQAEAGLAGMLGQLRGKPLPLAFRPCAPAPALAWLTERFSLWKNWVSLIIQ